MRQGRCSAHQCFLAASLEGDASSEVGTQQEQPRQSIHNLLSEALKQGMKHVLYASNEPDKSQLHRGFL